jgi:hypothetical protein
MREPMRFLLSLGGKRMALLSLVTINNGHFLGLKIFFFFSFKIRTGTLFPLFFSFINITYSNIVL